MLNQEGSKEQTVFAGIQLPSGFRFSDEYYREDKRLNKLDLRVGHLVADDASNINFSSTRQAELYCRLNSKRKSYLPTLGLDTFRKAIIDLLLPPATRRKTPNSFAIAQSIGATGAINIGAKLLSSILPSNTVFIPEESWKDHSRIFDSAGISISRYPYLKSQGPAENVLSAMRSAPEQSIFLLQICGHNPTGADLDMPTWEKAAKLCEARRLLPFFDIAYLGYGSDPTSDIRPLKIFCQKRMDLLIAFSCCKTFCVPDSRVGALILSCANKPSCHEIENKLQKIIRISYSSPPAEGAAIVSHILHTKKLLSLWKSELQKARQMIDKRREHLIFCLKKAGIMDNFPWIDGQHGLFAWTGFSKDQVTFLRERHAIYLSSDGRISLGALPGNEIARLANAMSSAIKYEY